MGTVSCAAATGDVSKLGKGLAADATSAVKTSGVTIPAFIAKVINTYESSGFHSDELDNFLMSMANHEDSRPLLISADGDNFLSWYNESGYGGLTADELKQYVQDGSIDLDREKEIVTGYQAEKIINALNSNNSYKICVSLYTGGYSDRYNNLMPELTQWATQAAIDKFGIDDFKNCIINILCDAGGYEPETWWAVLKNSKALQDYFGITPYQYKSMMAKGQYKQLFKKG